MAELRLEKREFTTTELANLVIAHGRPEGPTIPEGTEPETPHVLAAVSEPMPLFSALEMADFRSQWSKVQTGFVDEPRQTVAEADKLVAAVMQRLAEGFANERSGLEKRIAGYPGRAPGPGHFLHVRPQRAALAGRGA